ncbi:MAG: phytoene/squalene synthase family protein [Pseudomonadota bacterium]
MSSSSETGQLTSTSNAGVSPASATAASASPSSTIRDHEAYQEQALPEVSRTFALTIPQLPGKLRTVVTNAYLLCRIADTIEDDGGLSVATKHRLHQEFIEVIAGTRNARAFSEALVPMVSRDMLPAEIELIANTDRVVAVTHSFNASQRAALERCVTIMCKGMPRFQNDKSLRGLKDLEELNEYCYYVAGVVGEMLTELFIDYSPQIAERGDEMRRLAICFGQGLQMTNILKDVWEDRRTDTCWLPRDVFEALGFDLADLTPGKHVDAFGQGMRQLVGVAHGHLRRALEYTLLLPKRETGLRRFCLWAISLAVFTLRKVNGNLAFTSGQDVKVTRTTVRTTVLVGSLAAGNDTAVRVLFNSIAGGLPLAPPADPLTAPASAST